MQIWTRLTWTWPCRLENLRVIFFFFFFESHILEHYKLQHHISAPTEHKCSALWIHGCYDHVNTSDFVYFLSLSILYHLRSVAEAGRHVLYVRILTCMYTCAHHVYILLPSWSASLKNLTTQYLSLSGTVLKDGFVPLDPVKAVD